jgi:hypothetical protein
MQTTHALRARLQARRPPRPAARDATAHELLGAGHPLARMEARIRMLVAQSTGVSTLAALIGLVWLVEPEGRYVFALGAAAVVQAVLALSLVLTAHAKREAVLRLIAQGRGDLPLASVARLRPRLVRPKQRERLARSLDEMRREVARPLRGQLPLYSRAAVHAVDRELAKVAHLLRAHHVSPDGVAMAQLLLSAESSPLYGSDPEQLRRELGRLTFVLGAAAAHESV